jgi:hypothetical protein
MLPWDGPWLCFDTSAAWPSRTSSRSKHVTPELGQVEPLSGKHAKPNKLVITLRELP